MDPKLINDLKNSLNLAPIGYNLENYVITKNSKPSCLKSDRFVVNLYEKPSFSEKRLSISKNALLTIKHDNKNSSVYHEMTRKTTDLSCKKQQTAMAQFAKLKKQHDVECLKIKEASNVLQILNTSSPYEYWSEKLLAEKVLLTSGYTVKLLDDKIKNVYIEIEEPLNIGIISIKQCRFYLEELTAKRKSTEFFILLLANGINVRTSKVTRAVNGEIVFDENFDFTINQDFNVKVKIFSLIMKDAPKLQKLVTRLMQKKLKLQSACSLHYKNLNTSIYEDIKVPKTAFQFRGEASINSATMHKKTRELKLADLSYKNLSSVCNFSLQLKDFTASVSTKGFLTVGHLLKDAIIWDRRWCVLDTILLKIYCAPDQEDFVEASIVINLDKSQSNKAVVAKEIMCNRTKCFILDIADDNIVKKYYFKADNDVDLNNWVSKINDALSLLHLKQKLLNIN